MDDKPNTTQDIAVLMFSDFCARMSDYGFSNEDIIYALQISVAGMKAVAERSISPIEAMMESMGFKLAEKDSDGNCSCPVCVARRARGQYRPHEKRPSA